VDERKLVLIALMTAFALQFGWVFAMQRSCVVSVNSKGGDAAKALCDIASDRFQVVSRSAQDVFLSLLVPVSAAAAAAAARRAATRKLPTDGGPEDGGMR
jgi:hypothetical protein